MFFVIKYKNFHKIEEIVIESITVARSRNSENLVAEFYIRILLLLREEFVIRILDE